MPRFRTIAFSAAGLVFIAAAVDNASRPGGAARTPPAAIPRAAAAPIPAGAAGVHPEMGWPGPQVVAMPRSAAGPIFAPDKAASAPIPAPAEPAIAWVTARVSRPIPIPGWRPRP